MRLEEQLKEILQQILEQIPNGPMFSELPDTAEDEELCGKVRELRPLVKDTTPGIPREWLRVSEAMEFTGLSKPTLYSLFNRGLVKTVSLRERGKQRGVRLVSVDSLRTFLESRSSGGISE